MLDKYLDNVKDRATAFLTDGTISAMDHLSLAGLSAALTVDTDADEDDNDDKDDHDDLRMMMMRRRWTLMMSSEDY